ncbi:unnamed protein product [Prorocentrum cordatum]|uniref:Uncharacterized protein n=1 Tax=Prorocentrum cordatum TaxID=2364126 RepID=A0ABN9SG92_9DINO|nr:unnamed protein product [Polarella glacialis]
MQEYGVCCGEAETVALDCLQGISMRPSDRLKLAEQAATLSKRARQAETRYYASVEEANKALAAFDEKMPTALSTLQDMDQQRAECICSGLGKLVGLEEQCLRDAQEDFAGVKQAHQAADPVADIQDFIQRHQGQVAQGESFGYARAVLHLRLVEPRQQEQQGDCEAALCGGVHAPDGREAAAAGVPPLLRGPQALRRGRGEGPPGAAPARDARRAPARGGGAGLVQ